MLFLGLSRAVYHVIGAILRLFRLSNVIIFEVEHGARDNARAVLHEVLRRDWNKRYRIILLSDDPGSIQLRRIKRVTVLKRIEYGDSWFAKMRMRWLHLRACLIIDENKQIKKKNPKSIHVFLTHGSPLKDTRGYYTCTEDTDYALCQSEFWRPIVSYKSPVPPERRVILGQPRNDALFNSPASLKELFEEQYKKVVVWYPTFRQHKCGAIVQGTDSAPIPIIHNEDAAKKINEIAANYGVLIVVKPHPAQDISLVKKLNLDHLKVITDDFFIKHGVTSYEFLGKTDALITDYSSVIFDYLLTRKPIALAQEDYEEYEKKVGFAVDMDLLRSCAVQLNAPQDFEGFFSDLVDGNDPLREKREELMHLTNQYVDGNSTKRVVDWLESLLNTVSE